MWESVRGGLQPQPWHHNVVSALPDPKFSKFGPHLHRYQCMGAPICTSTAHMKVLKQFYTSNMDYMTNPLLRYRLTFLSRRTGSVPGEAKSVTSPVTSTKKADFGGLVGKEAVIFFNQTLQGSYWELLEWIGLVRIGPEAIWKMAFSLVDPLPAALPPLSEERREECVL